MKNYSEIIWPVLAVFLLLTPSLHGRGLPVENELAVASFSPQKALHPNKRKLYFIEEGAIYEKNLKTEKIRKIPQTYEVDSILFYQGELIALQSNGSLFVHSPKFIQRMLFTVSVGWKALARNVAAIANYGNKELLLLKKDGTLELIVNPEDLSHPATDIEILRTGVSNIKSLLIEESEVKGEKDSILLQHRNGEKESYEIYRELLDPENRDLEFHFFQEISPLNLYCKLSNNTQEKIDSLWIEKSMGDLYATITLKIKRSGIDYLAQYEVSIIKFLPHINIPRMFIRDTTPVRNMLDDIVLPLEKFNGKTIDSCGKSLKQ